ncbi:MAG: FAD-binding oxidoreductase [Arenicellales bacterium]|nr:FAD-binding oxidoreductase [Arenicellales bacterium]
MNSPPLPESLLDEIAQVVGPRGHTRKGDEIAPYCRSWRDNWRGSVPMVVSPKSTDEVAQVVTLCARHQIPIVPQGGNTGLTGGSQPHDDDSEIILSTSRLNRIRSVDPTNNTMTVEAGCILQSIQLAAKEHDRLFPLSLAAEGSCQIGGNIATNAGGTQVLRYGSLRNLVLGLEVVLADGSLWEGLRGLRKDNTGYDMKQLFIGSEGTLGVITAAVIKLSPLPKERQTALIAVTEPLMAVTLLSNFQQRAGEQVTSFELIKRELFDFVFSHIPGSRDPFSQSHPWYVLVELDGQGDQGSLRPIMEELLTDGVECGLVADGVIAESADQADRLWHLRESIAEAQNHEGGSIKHDIALPLSSIADFIAEGTRELEVSFPGVRVAPFGHLGDGNLHFNVAQPVGADRETFEQQRGLINRIVHDLVATYSGSISAEHGIGRLRREENRRYKSVVEMALMRKIKEALDPNNIMNPGKVL